MSKKTNISIYLIAIVIELMAVNTAFADEFSITPGQNRTFSNCNFHESWFGNDPNNLLPWPDARVADANGNYANVSLCAEPGHAGVAYARTGVKFNLEGQYDWDVVSNWQVNVTVVFSYSISADWIFPTGSGNAWVDLPTYENYDCIGFETGETGSRSFQMISYLWKTTLGQLQDEFGATIALTAECQAHVSDQSSNTNNSSAQLYIHSIDIEFTTATVISFLDEEDLSRHVKGAVADGSSRVIVELHGVQSSADVTFPAGDGTWVSDATLQNGVWRRTWQAPESYGPFNEVPRQIGFAITIDDQSIESQSFDLYKAPVVLLHGAYGYPGGMMDLKNALENDGFLFVCNEPYPNKASFAQNAWVPQVHVRHALDSAINHGLVAKKADIVGYSMGGCLAKLYGHISYVRRIVTIGTPHFGIPWFNLLLANFNPAFIKQLGGDAVFDLQTGGRNVPGNNLHVPVRAIAGDSSSVIYPWSSGDSLGQLLSLLPFGLGGTLSDFRTVVFEGVANDWVVSVPSQAGDLSAIPVHGTGHLDEPRNSEVIGHVTDFLDAPTASAGMAIDKSAQPQIQMSLSANASPAPPTYLQLANSEGEIAIITPTAGTVCSPSDTLHVILTVPPNTTKVWVATPGSAAAISETPPFATDITIPQEAIGQRSIIAVAWGEQGFLAATSTVVNVATSASVGWLKVWPDSVLYLRTGDTVPFVVHGVFSDGVERDITASQCGTTYTTTNFSVASIDTQGVLTARAPGFCLVIVSNGSSLTIPLLVKIPAPSLPIVSSFRINNGATETVSRLVTLNNVCTGNPTEYMASETASFSGSAWQPYVPSPTFVLSPGNGSKWVAFKVRNAAGESSVSSSAIVLNEAPAVKPGVAFFSINNGADKATTLAVTLNNTCTSNPLEYLASENEDFAGASWLPYFTAPAFVLSAGEGAKVVFFKVRNTAGESAVAHDAILFGVADFNFTSQRIRSTHTEAWNRRKQNIVSTDRYSFTAKAQLPTEFDLAKVDANTSVSILAGDVYFEDTLGHAARKNLKAPDKGGKATFILKQPDAKGTSRTVETIAISWTAKKVLKVTLTGTPLARDGSVVGNIVNLATQTDGPVSTKAQTFVAFGAVFAENAGVTCSGKKKTKSVSGVAGKKLISWSVSGK
ncbi:MAG: alpha/beta fold hydrolase [Candidatus Sumerlaeota bacterium]|nr:alpha/beta fold hydrolase [Candidatus Sumerlaeota bacterium]